jgi:alanine racemase
VLHKNKRLKLAYTYSEIKKVIKSDSTSNSSELITQVAYDSRKIVEGKNTLFFALIGEYRNGHSFIQAAFEKGVSHFVVSEEKWKHEFPTAHFSVVKDTLFALQELAKFHRAKFAYPIIAITGSAGKTTVKEWIYHLLSPTFRIIRSPKSYNSQLGVALSLLELNEQCDLAIIEVGISHPGEMQRLREIVQPKIGVMTSFGSSHLENFTSSEALLQEKLTLFDSILTSIFPDNIPLSKEVLKATNGSQIPLDFMSLEAKWLPFTDKVNQTNGLLALAVAKLFLKDTTMLKERATSLPQLAMRMEIFEGINNTTIINDTYNLDIDALTYSLEFQVQKAQNKKRIVIIGLDEENEYKRSQIQQLIESFEPDEFFILKPTEVVQSSFHDAIILIKGTRKSDMQRIARQFRLKNHKTVLEVDLNALKNNIQVFKSKLLPSTKMLAMVKAQSYGSGVEKIAQFLALNGVDYLGVAYADEGVELRKQGIETPILVMNAETEGFEDCIQYQLEPAIYSFHQLDTFVKELIFHGKSGFPVHLKIDTGMKRLGFDLEEIHAVCEVLNAQPELKIQSVYTHLADADNRRDKRFTEYQLQQFSKAVQLLSQAIPYHFDRHALNSEGIAHFPSAQFEMVRIGIGMFGVTSDPATQRKLAPVLQWKSALSQVKKVKKGESVGYSRTFIAPNDMKIGIVPIGYADGLKRTLSNGVGCVFVNNISCPIVGRICMDMIMIDLGKLDVNEGTAVEIIGKNQSLQQLAEKMNTIPYEVMTSISKRVHKIYLES